MSRILLNELNELNKKIALYRADNSKVIFTIKECVGRGASCVVYRAECEDKTEHLLKEYYPKNLFLERGADGSLIIPEAKREQFNDGLNRFHDSAEKQKTIRLSTELKNYTSNIQGYFYGNGTEYMGMTCMQGKVYGKVEETSLHSLMLRMRILVQVIGKYHKAGFLHLDIKPDNIYVRPEDETAEDVILFDFDSVVEKDSVTNTPSISYTKEWAAPEQVLSYKRKDVCEATDLFAIGEILFYKIFSRHSTQYERRSFSKFEYNTADGILQNANPKVLKILTEIFKVILSR